MTTRTVLLGLDGATFSILDRLIEDGTMPFLRDFVASGVRAQLRSTVPALTPPAWTSLVTGQGPGQHGIFDFFRKGSPQSHEIRFLTSGDIGCETLWSILSRHGRRATILNFPLTFPAPAINGFVVPGGWMPWRQLRLGCHPPGLYDRLKSLPGFSPRELAMDMRQEEKALEGCSDDEYAAWIVLHTRREQHWYNVVDALMQDDPTDMVAVLFDGVDKLQHLCWRFIDPAFAHTLVSPLEQELREQCRTYFRELDSIMAQIVQRAGPDATVIVASDHGFGPQVRMFFANAWLNQQGYLHWSDGRGPQPSEQRVLGMRELARHTYQIDWQRTCAYAPMPSGNGIHIVRADSDHPHGVPDHAYEAVRDRLIAELLAVRDPLTGEPVVARVWKREQIFPGPFIELAPDITLELHDGGLPSILASDVVVRPRAQPTGSHRPEGIFIARGPGLRQGVAIGELSIVDVAPLVLWSLDVPVPEDMQGQTPAAAIEPTTLTARPVRAGRTEVAEAAVATAMPEPIWDEEGEAEILRRLQALGYVE